MINEIEVIIKNAKKSGEFYQRVIPEEMFIMDAKFTKLIEKLSEYNNEIKKHITMDIAWFVLSYSWRMATYVLRSSRQKEFNDGLLGLEFIYDTIDKREIMIVLSLYSDLSKRKNLNFKEIINRKTDFSSFVLKFINRDEGKNSIQCMGVSLVKDERNNLTYKRNI